MAEQTGPYSQDLLTRIYNVQWGGDLIVVFMETSAFDPQPVYDLSPTESATFLSTWHTPTYSTDPVPLKNSAYKVKQDAGVFLKSTAPPLDADVNGTWLNVLVFSAETSLSQVVDATKLMAPALYIVNALNADLPSEVAPPGLLWGVQTGAMAPGVTMAWKMRFGEHRTSDSGSPLPDIMVQCYPLSSSHPGYIADTKVTWSGYYLIAYRLDEDGTGPVYSKSPKFTDFGQVQNLPPEWNVSIVSGPYPSSGIPFADPPPMISADVK